MAEEVKHSLVFFIFVCGILLFVCGFVSEVAGFIWVDYEDYNFYNRGGDGLWSGFWLQVNGAFGAGIFWHRRLRVARYFTLVSLLTVLVSGFQGWLSSVTYAKVKKYLDTSLVCRAEDSITTFCEIVGGQGRIDAVFRTIITASIIGAVLSFLGTIITTKAIQSQESDQDALAEDGNG